MDDLKIGIDNYGLFPLDPDPLETLQWALDNGAQGVAFSGLNDRQREKCTADSLSQIKLFAESHNLYLEWGGAQHIPWDLARWQKKDLFEHNRRCITEANILETRVIRSCSGGLMRWNPDSVPTQTLLRGMAKSLLEQKSLIKDHGVILAIETHFEFTTFELQQLFDMCKAGPGDWLGICLDTMNLLTMLEDPLWATDRILPWVVSTHIKDGGIIKTTEGFKSFTAPLGTGIIDLKTIISKLKTLPWPVNLNIEDHGGDFNIPIQDPRLRMEFPDLTHSEFEQIEHLANETETKMKTENLAILNRSDWPHICESRLLHNLINLHNLITP